MDLLERLNPQQREAVQHGKGPALVLAGAGSGKTRVIAYRIAYLIRNGATRPENILAVTFTNKAAKEMRERMQSLLDVNRNSEPLISTFHSFCVRLLRREIQGLGYKKDFSIYDADDQKRLIKQIMQESAKNETDLSPREILSRISFAKNLDVSPEAYPHRFPSADAELIQHFYSRYNERLRQANALDFDDLLLKTVEVMRKFPRVRDYYSDWYHYILVDEYQDTNRPQYELLRLLTAKHDNVFAVGDEDQSIYKFRGADIQNILRFENDFPGTRIIKLEQNYRSTRNILRVASAVVENNKERKGKVLWTDNGEGETATCRRAGSPQKEALWIADQIEQILENNPDYHVAILYRANFLSRNFEDILTERGIPYAVVGSVAFFGRMEVKDMLAYLKLVFNPEDDIALLRIINTPPRGIGAATIDRLTQAALEKGIPLLQAARELTANPETLGRSSRVLVKFHNMLDRWTGQKDDLSAGELLEGILKDTDYKGMLLKQESAEEAETRMENIQELIRAAEESEERGETIFEFLDRASLSSELDHLDPNAKVALMTLHSAKGLEFDAVFLAGLEEGLFPHSLSQNSREDLEEERRLCYVGITRARRKLFLTWTPFRRNFGSNAATPSQPSRFLGEMPVELVEGLEESYEQDFGTGRYYVEENDEDDYEEDSKNIYARHSPRENDRRATKPKSIAELRAFIQKTQDSGKTATGQSEAKRLAKPGVRVRHPMFGDGIVLNREKVGNDIKLVVSFSRAGRKTLLEKYAKLEIL
jgi:DNA helicase II / ATP-dependent DNA helicase PcrA